MPIYAFQCAECGHDFDRLQKLSDPDPTVCPSCGAEAVKRQVTAPSFRLAGGGWYETDFKKSGDKKRNLAESASTSATHSGSSAASSSGGDAKPAAAPKAESKPAS